MMRHVLPSFEKFFGAILIFVFVAFSTRVNAAISTNPPNVLFIVSDDLNDWIGCLHGHPQARTPNLDQLASRGTLFANAHCQAPLCNPSRSSVLSGLRPGTTGIYGLKPGIRDVAATRHAITLPQWFAKHGYFTASFGKVFHDSAIAAKDRPNEFNVWGPSPTTKLPENKFVNTPAKMRLMDWAPFPVDDHDVADWKTADNAIAQWKNRPKDKPIFLAVGFRLPHVPLFVPQKWFDLFPSEDKIILPPYLENDRDDIPKFSAYLYWKEPEPRTSWLKKSHQWRPLVRSYLAGTAFMDAQVGRVLEALKNDVAYTNTVIVFWGDNGWHLGEKEITGKNSLWERSTHVPLIFAGVRVATNQICSEPVELLDIYPTLAQLCGLPIPSHVEGHSLHPQLRDAKTKRKWPAITTHNQGNDSVRTKDWRYIRYANGSEELYHCSIDPNEWTNVVDRTENRSIVKTLSDLLPKIDLAAAPGSKSRVLTQTNGVWFWEGKKIIDAESTLP
jgi:arylsulfatase A-like enzyme